MLLLRCSSLTLQITKTFSDLYSSQIKELNYNPFSCAKTRIIFQNSTKHLCLCSKTGATIQKFFFFRLFLDHSTQKSSNKPFLKLRGYVFSTTFSYMLFTKHTSTQFNHTSQLIHQNAQRMHDLTLFPSSPK